MPEPRIIYFNLRAKGELLRFIALAGGVKFKDERLAFGEEWTSNYKPQTPYGQVPCLVVDGKWYAQKLAIALYLGKKGGLYPTSNDLETLQYDSVFLFTDEILDNLLDGFRDKKFRQNLETLEKLKTDTLPKKLEILEKIAKTNGTGYLVGSKLSIVDLGAFDILEHIVDIGGLSYLDPYPTLKALYQKIGAMEAIKNYIASRPPIMDGFDF